MAIIKSRMERLLFLLCMHICAVGQLVGFAQGEECQRMLSSPGGGLLESGAIDVTTSEEYFIRGLLLSSLVHLKLAC